MGSSAMSHTVPRLLAQNATSLLIDGRAEAGPKLRVRNAVSIPLPDASKAKDDGRLPMTDHNTRIFVVGTNGTEARTGRGNRA